MESVNMETSRIESSNQNPNPSRNSVDSPNLKKRRYYGNWFCKKRSEERGTTYWVLAQKLAVEIVNTHRDKLETPCVASVRLNHLGIEPDDGVVFLMDFEVEGEDGKTSPYFAKVWLQVGRTTKPEVMSFAKVIYPGNSKKGKKVPLYTKKPPVVDTKLFDGIDEYTREFVCGKNNCKLRTRGFYILLNQIREQSPWKKYAALKRDAKTVWREYEGKDKLKFMEYAAMRLNYKIRSQLFHRTRGGKIFNDADGTDLLCPEYAG